MDESQGHDSERIKLITERQILHAPTYEVTQIATELN